MSTQIKKNQIDTNIINGWTPISAITRVSDTTATLVGDWTNRIQKGDKLWWLSNSASRYNYIIAISYSSGTGLTTITITSGYITTANDARFESGHTLTAPYISHIENPMGFQGFLYFTPSWTGLTVGSASNVGRFSINGRLVKYRVLFTFAADTSVSNFLYCTYPVTPNSTSSYIIYGNIILSDAGTARYYGKHFGDGEVGSIKTDATYASNPGTNVSIPFTWTTNDAINISGSYEI